MSDVNDTQWGQINQPTQWNGERPERAFPSTFKSVDEKSQIHAWGMELRDYFAAKAMQGLATDPRLGPDGEAALAYRWADAMMKARMKPRQD